MPNNIEAFMKSAYKREQKLGRVFSDTEALSKELGINLTPQEVEQIKRGDPQANISVSNAETDLQVSSYLSAVLKSDEVSRDDWLSAPHDVANRLGVQFSDAAASRFSEVISASNAMRMGGPEAVNPIIVAIIVVRIAFPFNKPDVIDPNEIDRF